MNGNTPAAAELDVLLGHSALRGRWPGGFTSDDVLAELTRLGRIAIDVRDQATGKDRPAPFACRLELRDEGVGAIFGEGLSLTAAALRCLIEADCEVAAEVQRGIDAFGDLLRDR